MRRVTPFILALSLSACAGNAVDELYASLEEIAHETCTCEEREGRRPLAECTMAWAEGDERRRPCHELMQERYPEEIRPAITCVTEVTRDWSRCLRENDCGATVDCGAIQARYDDCPELPELNDPEIDACL